MVSGSLCPCPEGRVMWRDGRPLMCLLHCTGMWGWWGLVDNTEAIAALQSPPFCVMGADRDQMGHKCAPKLPGRCTLWYTLRDLSSDHLDRGTCWTSDMESGNGLDTLVSGCWEMPLGLTAQTQPVTPLSPLILMESCGSACFDFSACCAGPCCIAPTAPPGRYCLQSRIAHYHPLAEVQRGWMLPLVYREDG